MKIGIIASPDRKTESAENACDKLGISYIIIDLFSDNWVEQIQNGKCTGYLLIPPHSTSLWRDIYKKRLILMGSEFDNKCIPSVESIIFYESKILMADVYKIYSIPHAEMHTFFNFREAMQYTKNTSYPMIIKSDGGSGGVGVKFIETRLKLQCQILKSFFYKLNFSGLHTISDLKNAIKRKLYPLVLFARNDKQYIPRQEVNNGYIHIQNVVDVKAEWRIIRIGDSFFSHQKLEGKNKLHSGSKRKRWDIPPINILNEVKKWSDKLKINSGAFDIFETNDGKFLVNEIQAHFGTSLSVQMYKDGVPGRLKYTNGEWEFEEGDFCQLDCNLLKIQELINQDKVKKYNDVVTVNEK